MHYYRAFGLNIASDIALPELVQSPDVAPDLTIQIGKVDCPEMVATQIYRRGIQAHFGRDFKGALYFNWKGIAAFRAEAGQSLIVDAFTKDLNLLSLFTVSEALGLICFQKSYLLLHASAVQVGNEAWCFMGEPGAGKSSSAAAFVKHGCPLLSDDLTAIRIDDNGTPYVIPAYPQLKIWERTVEGLGYSRETISPVSEGVNKFAHAPASAFPSREVKLSKLFFLHNDNAGGQLAKLNAGTVPGELIKNFPLPSELLAGDYLQTHFLKSLQVAAKTEIYKMRRPDGFSKLEAWVQDAIGAPLTDGEP